MLPFLDSLTSSYLKFFITCSNLSFVASLALAKVLPSKKLSSDSELLKAAQAEGKVSTEEVAPEVEKTATDSSDWWKEAASAE